MNHPFAIDTLVAALTAVPEYKYPLNPIHEALSQHLSLTGRPLTLQAIRQHSQLLHDHADQERDQSLAINTVIRACKPIPPIPLPYLPLGF